MSVAKPVLRRLLQDKTKIDFGVAIVISLGVALAYKYGVQEPRREKFHNFYKTYDAEKHYNRMKKAGVFQCINKAVEEGKMTVD